MVQSPSLKLVRPASGALPEAVREGVQPALALTEPYYRDVRLASGEPALDHALGTMGIVSELKLDTEALSAALLAPAVRARRARLKEIAERCGPVVAELAARNPAG